MMTPAKPIPTPPEPPKNLKWRLYYSDGSTYDGNCEAHAMRAPRADVQMYKEQADHLHSGYSLRHGCAFVCWMGNRWSCRNDATGWTDYLIHKDGPQKILIGREVYDDLYQAVGRQADLDGCFCEGPCGHKRGKSSG